MNAASVGCVGVADISGSKAQGGISFTALRGPGVPVFSEGAQGFRRSGSAIGSGACIIPHVVPCRTSDPSRRRALKLKLPSLEWVHVCASLLALQNRDRSEHGQS